MVTRARKKITGGLAAALIVATPLVATFEGLKTDPYVDIAGVPTVCYGETRIEMRKYTKAECDKMLTEAISGFGEGVLKVTPNLEGHPYQLAAAISLAYNIGLENYKKSSVARVFNLGYFKQACNNFLSWDKIRKAGKLVKSDGLHNRREKERQVCLTDATT